MTFSSNPTYTLTKNNNKAIRDDNGNGDVNGTVDTIDPLIFNEFKGISNSFSTHQNISLFHLCIYLILSITFFLNCIAAGQRELAGETIFPEKEYEEWLEIQSDGSITESEKIKNTINAFFLLKYETWYQDKFLDFGFLFNKNDQDAYGDYVYERGLLYIAVAARRYYNSKIYGYDYVPQFRNINISGGTATVKMRPMAWILWSKNPDNSGTTPFGDYEINLTRQAGIWLIQNTECSDTSHRLNPRGMDFNKYVEEMPERIKSAEREADARVDALRSNPRFKEKIEEREKFAEQQRREANRLNIFKKIAGKYRFETGSKTFVMNFYVKDGVLVGNKIGDQAQFILIRINEEGLSFETKGNLDYKFVFIQGEDRNIVECILRHKNIEYRGKKIK